MAEATTPLAATFEEFDEARGDSADGAWALAVAATLMMRDVDVDVDAVREGLADDLELVRRTGEPAADLFGDARSHADELYSRWLSDGLLRRDLEPLVGWPEVPSSGLLVAGVMAVLATAGLRLDGPSITWTAGLVLMPVVVGLGACSALATWHAQRLRRSSAAAAVAAGGVVLLAAVLLAGVFAAGDAHPIGTASVWLMLLVAAGCLALGVLLDGDPAPPARSQAPLDDDAWAARVAGLLRVGADLPETRVRSLVEEARAHAREAGSSLVDEFGSPEQYAASFAPDRRARSRRRALAYGVAGTVAVLPAAAEPRSWSSVALAALLCCLAAREVARAGRKRRD